MHNTNYVSYELVEELLEKLGFDPERRKMYCELLDGSADRSSRVISAKDFNQILYVLNIKLSPQSANQPASGFTKFLQDLFHNTVYLGPYIGTYCPLFAF